MPEKQEPPCLDERPRKRLASLADQLESFQYSPLPSDPRGTPYIRLLELSDKIDSKGCIVCGLIEVKFDDTCPQYETLSYVWGRDPTMINVDVDNKALDITGSLHRALHGLQTPGETRYLWIDQISINQKDDEEKSQQVAIMRDIYQRSSRTTAWIKLFFQNQSYVEDTFACLRIVAEAYKDIREQHSAESFLSHLAQSVDVDWRVSAGIGGLITSLWFTRVWIIQEATVSNNLIIQYGDQLMEFSSMAVAIFLTLELQRMKSDQRYSFGNARNLFSIFMMHTTFQTSNFMELSDLLVMFHQFRATDPRDKLFSLYGLTSTNLSSLGLAADYTLEARTAITQAMFRLCQHTNSLELLELCEGYQINDNDLPSWVPASDGPELFDSQWNWFDHVFKTELVNFVLGEKEFTGLLEKLPKSSANLGDIRPEADASDLCLFTPRHPTKPILLELEMDGVLKVTGQFLDIIDETSAPLEYRTFDKETSFQETSYRNTERQEDISKIRAESGWPRLLKFAFQDYSRVITRARDGLRTELEREEMIQNRAYRFRSPTGESVQQAYCKTLCAGRLVMSEERTIHAFKVWRESLRHARSLDLRRQSWGIKRSTGLLTRFAASWGEQYNEDALLLRKEMDKSYGRRLSWTKRGYLALTPACSQVGDLIFWIYGGQLPFILRPATEAGTYYLLGSSYVHGLTNGDFLDPDATSTLRIV